MCLWRLIMSSKKIIGVTYYLFMCTYDNWRLMEDRRLWSLHTSKKHTVNSAYNLLLSTNQQHTANDDTVFWHCDAHLKVNLFLWRLLRKRLLTKDNWVNRQLSLEIVSFLNYFSSINKTSITPWNCTTLINLPPPSNSYVSQHDVLQILPKVLHLCAKYLRTWKFIYSFSDPWL